MSLSYRVREARLATGLSQSDLAGRLGVTQSTVALWETGKTAPRRSLMPKLAAVLKVTVMELEHGTAGGAVNVAVYSERSRAMVSSKIANPATDNPVIAFQGVPGAYGHLACRAAFPAMDPLPCPTFADAFAAVEEGRAGLAMIPIENSVAGRVADAVRSVIVDAGRVP